MKNVMIDIETMGTNIKAPVLSIGACFFDPATGTPGEGFHRRINWTTGFDGRVVDPSTVKWWMKQSHDARSSILREGSDVTSVLYDFCLFFTRNGGQNPWGNGATFDISMLEDLLNQHGINIPWKFWAIRDVRTVVDLADGIVDRADFKFEGTAHNAYHDALHQAKYVSAMYQALRAGKVKS